MNRTVSTCCGEAVVVRTLGGDCPEWNWYECVKCEQPCDVKQQETE